MISSQTLITPLNKLGYDERRILMVLAVLYAPINQTELKKFLDQLGWKTGDDRALSSLVGKPLWDRLLKAKLVQSSSLTQNQIACWGDVADSLARQAVKEDQYRRIAQAGQKVRPYLPYYYFAQSQTQTQVDRVRRMRDALYQGQEQAVLTQLGSDAPFQATNEEARKRLTAICTRAFSPEWFAGLPEGIQYPVLEQLLGEHGSWYDYVHERHQQGGFTHPAFGRLLAEQQLRRGCPAKAEALLAPGDAAWQALALRGWLHFLRGDYAASIDRYVDALAAKRKETRKRDVCFTGTAGFCFLLALLHSEESEHRALLNRQLQIVKKNADSHLLFAARCINEFLSVLRGEKRFNECRNLNRFDTRFWPEEDLLQALAAHWLGVRPDNRCLKNVAEDAVQAQAAGWTWYVTESVALLRHYGFDGNRGFDGNKVKGLAAPLAREPVIQDSVSQGSVAEGSLAEGSLAEGSVVQESVTQAPVARHRGDIEFVSLLTLIKPRPAWERALQALRAVNPAASTAEAGNGADTRLVWHLETVREMNHDSYMLRPREQKRLKGGRWSVGRVVALKRLSETPEEIECLTEHDRKICRCIYREEPDYGYDHYGQTGYLLNDEGLLAAVGHPHVYWPELPETPVEVVRHEPELLVRREREQLHLQLLPTPEIDSTIDGTEALEEYRDQYLIVQPEGRHRLTLTTFSRQHYQIARILGPDGLTVPFSAREQVLESLHAIAPLLTVQSDIGGGNTAEATEVSPDDRLHMHIQPAGTDLKFACYVMPLAQGGPLFRAGQGGATVLAEVEGQRLHTTRDLEGERQSFEALLNRCPALLSAGRGDGSSRLGTPDEAEWLLAEEPALEALYQLQAMGDDVVLAWPQGSRLQLVREASLQQMQVSVRQERDWFSVDGELRLDDDQVLSLENLLVLLQGSPGRFIRLGEDRFLALTGQLRQRLEALRSHGERRFHPLAAGTLDELTDGMAVSADKPWKTQLKKLREAHRRQPELPTTLQAELRGYQREGFQWLARLAHWGAGACLADDMGLGKTVQSLALILSRAAEGPSLILAPTSVCMNWLEEAERFAPTLRPLRFGNGDRQAMLDAAGPFDLIVCSYGLLQTEVERLARVDWHTVVADEAQALKNPHAKRTKAALALPGAFKMVATGTPIENHLGELWSLFQFINPGLLGSLQSFNQRFANPIENQRDAAVKQQLKRLVRPFILRRLKTEVLTELPARTEITLHVPLSEEEAALYEAVRRQALARLAEPADNQAQQRVKVLAEIMRLRRACCNPRLVMPDTQIPSAKLKAFGGILDELRENRHRALVFSQFVGHLALLREYLNERGIEYQYLDGSTPVKKRQAAVQAFQAGDGELFLISLKAGGSGLNLTAADYVIHMDPWWNPAVEDQASDRAHRLGQTRPVTIYRLVAENTIEDKIVNLHQHKRDLADSLLEGSDVSGQLSLDDIMGLIREQ